MEFGENEQSIVYFERNWEIPGERKLDLGSKFKTVDEMVRYRAKHKDNHRCTKSIGYSND